LLANEAAPVEVLADSAYRWGEFRAHLAHQGHTATIKPIPRTPTVVGGFTTTKFIIDMTTRTAPARIRSAPTSP
jgi:hypothetical protein